MRQAFPSSVRIIEVGPRDGLQNEKAMIPTADKLTLIRRLAVAGLSEIEITSFVSPKAIPQLADSVAVASSTTQSHDLKKIYWALVPNLKGFENALDSGVRHIAVFTAASETFNQKNINKSIAESFDAFAPVLKTAQAEGIVVRGYVSTAFYCPYEGMIDKEPVRRVSEKLLAMGVSEISIGDTIGKATPQQVLETVSYLQQRIPSSQLALHFHNTYDHALDNIQAGLSLGISAYDASVGGLGGCPYAPGASGNVSTEAVVDLMHGLGIETGIDPTALKQVAQWIRDRIEMLRQEQGLS